MKTMQQVRKSNDRRIEKVLLTDTTDAVFTELKKNPALPTSHMCEEGATAAAFESLKNSSNCQSIVLQVDFSENATIAAQKEVQAAHWSHGQATVFTAHAWIDNNINFSTVVISDDLNHTKHSICVFMQGMLRHL